MAAVEHEVPEAKKRKTSLASSAKSANQQVKKAPETLAVAANKKT
jgi:hypothetical protein